VPTKRAYYKVHLNWSFACITSGVLDLNSALINSTFAMNPAVATNSMLATQQSNSAGYPSFTDTLNDVQAPAEESQTGTGSSANTGQQFQTAISWQTTSAADQFGGGGPNWAAPQTSPAWRTTSPARPADTTTQPAEDRYVASGTKDLARANDDDAKAQSQPDSGTGKIASGKSTDKSKPRKETGPADKAAAHADSAHAASAVSGDGNSLKSAQPGTDPGGNGPGATSQPGSDTASSTTGASKAGDANAGLAFAVKINANDPGQVATPAVNSSASPVDTGDPQADPSGSISSSAFAGQLSAMMGVSAGQKGSANSSSAGQNATPGLTTVPLSSSKLTAGSSNETLAENETQDASKVTDVSEPEAPIAQPLKTVQVQITGADNQRIDLRLMEKGGALTMTVRSADGTLTKALQENLPELSSKLNDQQIRAEWWKPDNQTPGQPQKPDSSNTARDGNSGGTQDQANQGRSNSGQQGGRGARQPDWVEELSDTRNSIQNGRQYSWHL
jgi:hypothetical protein